MQDTDPQRLRILIVGAGIAGLTLAALLRRQGLRPTVIDKASDLNAGGYMLGLLPLGGRVLHGLDLHDAYLAASTPMREYEFGNSRGRVIKRFALDTLVKRYGAYQGITRGALVEILLRALPSNIVRLATTVASLTPREKAVDIELSDGTRARYDLVVGADGLHSDTRRRILAPDQYRDYDSGWGGWVTWAEPGTHAMDTYTEYWAAGWFVGLYPVKDALGVFLGGPAKRLRVLGRMGLAERLLRRHCGGELAAALTAARDAENPFFWQLSDCRCKHWRIGRVLLLGDAAAGFLPTAGVGASMAMQSSAALADELSRSDAAHLEHALDIFERRQRSNVEAAQKNSRQLARLMMLNSRPMTRLRDALLRFYTLRMALRDIVKIMDAAG